MVRHRLVASLAIIVVIAGVTGPIVTGPRLAPSQVAASLISDIQFVESPPEATVQHVDPETVYESGDRRSTREVLAVEIARNLRRGTLELGRGNYRKAVRISTTTLARQQKNHRGLVYGGERGTITRSERTYRILSTAITDHQQYSTTVRQYYRTLRAYERAQRRENASRVRRLGLELDGLAQNATSVHTNLTRSLSRVSNRTQVPLDNATAAVETVTANITRRQSTIRNQAFFETELSVTPTVDRISFSRPFEAVGRVTYQNGTGLPNQTGTVTIRNRTQSVRTNETGHFEVTYRPVNMPTAQSRLTVGFQPDQRSPYNGSQATVPITVSPTIPTANVTVSRKSLSYGSGFEITGRLRVNETGVGRVPLSIVVGPTQVGRTRTTPTGNFSLKTRLPASVPAGTAPVRVGLANSHRAIATSTPKTVEPLAASDLHLTVGNTSVPTREFTVSRKQVGTYRVSFAVPPNATIPGENATVTVTDRTDGTTDQVTIPWEESAGTNPTSGVTATALVFDTSGSLFGSKRRQGIAATNAYLGQLGADDYASLIGFNATAQTAFPMTAVTPAHRHRLNATLASWQPAMPRNRHLLRVALDARQPATPTNISAGLARGHAQLSNVSGGTARTAVLVSDGIDPEFGATEPVVRQYTDSEIPIHTVGVGTGNATNRRALKRIANETGGTFVRARNLSALPQLYRDQRDDSYRTRTISVSLRGDRVEPDLLPQGTRTAVRVNTTETRLNLSVSGLEETSVSGYLVTNGSGRPISNQTVLVYAGDHRLGNATTTLTGQFETTVKLPDQLVQRRDTVPITVRYPANDTNLNASTISLGLPTSGNGGLVRIVLAGLGALVLGIVALVTWWWRRQSRSAPEPPEELEPEPDPPTEEPQLGQLQQERQLLRQAEAELENGNVYAATELAFGAVRETFDEKQTLTHWELYRNNRDDLELPRQAKLRQLTRKYERIVFADTVDDRSVETIIDIAESFVPDDSAT